MGFGDWIFKDQIKQSSLEHLWTAMQKINLSGFFSYFYHLFEVHILDSLDGCNIFGTDIKVNSPLIGD